MMSTCREAERRVLRLLQRRPQTLTHLTQIHGHLLRHNLHQLNLLLSHFISALSSLHHQSRYALLVFRQTRHPNILLFNSILKSPPPNSSSSFLIFSTMKHRRVVPDEFTFPALLKSSSNLNDNIIGRCVHGEAMRSGYASFDRVKIAIVEMYVGFGTMRDACEVFDEMLERDVVVWNLMIRGFCDSGNVESGLGVFRRMGEKRNVVSWNTVISRLAQSGRNIEAVEVFKEMKEEGIEMDEVTLVSVLPVCGRAGDVEVGRWVHCYAEEKGLLGEFVAVGNALVSFYCKCGDLDAACGVFRGMEKKNVVTWNTLITGNGFNGKGELGVELFEEMMNAGEEPNEAAFVGVLACCAHAGLVEKGRDLFASMSLSHRIEPKLEHYGCMVDVLSRSGCLKEAHELIKSMPMKPNAALWGALLGACSTHGEANLAELAAKELIAVEPWNSGNYVLLSNIYAEECRWDEVENVRELMKKNCIIKAPGQSAIEVIKLQHNEET